MKKNEEKRAIITVIGKDKVGIVANVTNFLAKSEINIEEISQTILRDIFTMVILADLKKSQLTITELSRKLKKIGEKTGTEIHIQDEKIFESMHRV